MFLPLLEICVYHSHFHSFSKLHHCWTVRPHFPPQHHTCPTFHYISHLSHYGSHGSYILIPSSNQRISSFSAFSLPPHIPPPFWPTVAQFPPAPCWRTTPEAVVVNLKPWPMAWTFVVIHIFALANIFCQIPSQMLSSLNHTRTTRYTRITFSDHTIC